MSLEAQAKFTISAKDTSSGIIGGANRNLGKLGRTGRAVGRMLDGIGNRYTAIFSGAVGYGTLASIVSWETRFVRLGIAANKSAEEIERLKHHLFEVARAGDIRVDPGEMVGAIEEIMEKTGDLKFAEENIRNIGLAIQATGAAGKDIGGIMAEFQKMGITKPTQVLEALDILTVQGKEGAFTLQNLASLGSRVVTAYTAMGRTGVPAIREMGAALQMIRQGTGTAEMAATAFEALLRTLGDGAKVKKLQLAGIQVFDPEEMKKGKEVLRPINELMIDIVKRSGGKKTMLSEIFDAEAIRAFNSAATEFKQTGAIESLEKFYKVQADGSTITKDSQRAAKTFAASWQSLKTSWERFADINLAGPVERLASAMDKLKPETVDRIFKYATGASLVLGSLVVGRKVFNGVQAIRGMFGGKGAGGALGEPGNGKPIPVYVVNSGGMPGGMPGGAAAAAAAGSGLGLAVGGVLAGPALMAGAALASETAGKALAENQARHTSTKGLKALMGRHMVMGGGKNSYQVGMIDRELGRRSADVGGTIRVQIDSEGRPRVKEIRNNNRDVNFDVDAGMTMAAAH